MLHPSSLRGLLLAVAGVLAPISAQGLLPEPGLATIGAPEDVMQAFALRAGRLQQITPPVPVGNEITVLVQVGDAPRTLRLQPFDVRTPGFQLLVDDGLALHSVPTPPSVTWRGTLDGVADSAVAATIVNGQLEAVLRLGDHIWGIQPVSRLLPQFPPSLHVVYDHQDVVAGNVSCGVPQGPPPLRVGGGGAGPGPLALKQAELACDADLEFYQRNGSNTTTTQNTITGIVNGADVIYQRDVQITFRITTIIVRTTAVYVQTSMSSQLPEFGNYWNANHGGVVRDLAHLFTGKGTFSGVIGIAYVGVVCNVGNAYGVTKCFSSLTANVGLFCHEVGHNFNAPHCDSVSPCNIMCSGLGGCSGNIASFAPYSANIILAFKNSLTCLADPVPPPTITGISPGVVTTYAPAQVTVTGTNLDNVTRVTVGGVNAPSFTIVSPTTLRFTPPSLLRIQIQPVQVHTAANSSGIAVLVVTGNHPSALEVPLAIARNTPLPYKIHTDLAHVAILYLSGSNLPSVAPGVVSFGIGNNFSQLFDVGTAAADAAGQIQFNLTVPGSVGLGTVLYWQALTVNVNNLTLPLETTNVASNTVLF